MRQTKKGNSWHFRMKVSIGTDKQGLVHSLLTTDAAQADVNQLPGLIHGDERELYGDGAYWPESDRRPFREVKVRYWVNRRGYRAKSLNEYWKRLNHQRSRVRPMGEHAFHVAHAALGLQQGTLPRAGEEHRTGLCGLRPGEPVHGEAQAAPSWGVVSPATRREQRAPGTGENALKRALTPPFSPPNRPPKHLLAAGAALKHGCSDLPKIGRQQKTAQRRGLPWANL